LNHKFPYKWNLADGYPAKGIEPNGLKVFSCFACGGGSTMGYKLAGYDMLGCNEIDPEMIGAYRKNHDPKYSFLAPIQEFKNSKTFPDDLMNLDILDGSPPCSSFSMSGSREKKWGVKKKFREGQAEQILDDLFFDFLDLADRLRPKVIVAENVKGMLMGNAKSYVKKIQRRFKDIGYEVQLFLLNAATMGVPQKRERVFFIANRMGFGKLNLKFEEEPIPFKEFKSEPGIPLTAETKSVWQKKIPGDKSLADIHMRVSGVNKRFNARFIFDDKVCGTVSAGADSNPIRWDIPNRIGDHDLKCIGSYPQDYKFPKCGPQYLIGMSVPPIMTAQIAHQIYLQWFKNADRQKIS
jgi:DNA (cytosine-5)-methyltransferase 1